MKTSNHAEASHLAVAAEPRMIPGLHRLAVRSISAVSARVKGTGLAIRKIAAASMSILRLWLLDPMRYIAGRCFPHQIDRDGLPHHRQKKCCNNHNRTELEGA